MFKGCWRTAALLNKQTAIAKTSEFVCDDFICVLLRKYNFLDHW